MYNIVVSSRSKFATVASIRVLLVSIFVEVFFSVCFFVIYLHTGGYSFDEMSTANSTN